MKPIVGAIVALAFLSAPLPAYAIYTGAPVLDPSLGPWISSLWSDYGRCCDQADSIDPVWQFSKTSASGYALIIDGHSIDVDQGAVHITAPDPQTGIYRTVTDNLAKVPIAWVVEGNDLAGNPVFVVRCFLPGGAG